MFLQILKSKIHRVTVTEADLNYVGSITIDEDLMDAAHILSGEKVSVVDVTNGARLETYTIPGKRGSGRLYLYERCRCPPDEERRHSHHYGIRIDDRGRGSFFPSRYRIPDR